MATERDFDCAATLDALPELALGALTGPERDRVLEHVQRCRACRREAAELDDMVDLLVHVAPEIEPPVGFASRVAAAIGADRRQSPDGWRAFRMRTKVLAVAALAAASVIGTIATIRLLDAQPGDSQAIATTRTAPMIGSDGLDVGHAVITGTAPASVIVTVDYALADGAYTVRVGSEGRPTRSIGAMEVAAGRGTWTGSAPLAGGRATVSLIDTTGSVVCAASIDTRR